MSPKHSGFRPGDSCIWYPRNIQVSDLETLHQPWNFQTWILCISHEILSAFDIGFEVPGLFLDTSKALDKVWHAWLICKVLQNGICGDLINVLNDFLTNRKQRVNLNGQCSFWVDFRPGVLQGSVLELLLFWIYVNDSSSRHKDVAKASWKPLIFGLKDVLDWSEMKVTTTFF